MPEKKTYGPPPLRYTLVDFARKIIDYIDLKWHSRALRAAAPRGEGPVLVLPGILNSDLWTRPLRRFLRDQGYNAYGWNNGFNTGFSAATANHLAKRLREIFNENGGRKVAVVGHSLGGLYAHKLAQEFPNMVSKVVMLSAPLNLNAGLSAVTRPIRAIFKALSDKDSRLADETLFRRMLSPLPMPATSLLTRSDGIANGLACAQPASPLSENIEVNSSHAGMITNRAAFLAVADRLAQKDGDWCPFDAAAYPDWGPKPYDGPVPDIPEGLGAAPRIFLE